MTTRNRTMIALALAAVAMVGLAFTAASAKAGLLVYEGFQYGTAAATRARQRPPARTTRRLRRRHRRHRTGRHLAGFDRPSRQHYRHVFMASGSLSFGDLATTGNHVRGDTNLNNDLFSRSITASLSSGS